VAVRYPRGAGAGVTPLDDLSGLPYGRGEIRRQGKGLALLCFGTMLYPALAAAQALDATVVNMRWVKPMDLDLLREVAQSHTHLMTIEEGCLMGGAGSAVAEALGAMGLQRPLKPLGIPDHFVEHGDPAVLLSQLGLDAAGIEASARAFVSPAA
jgi:1-deoxy-D-xylulose-5-phosphate synthase